MSSTGVKIASLIVIALAVSIHIDHYTVDAQNARRNSNRINRMRGNILQNLTRTHAYDDNIVTSQLDASMRVRQFYRDIRNIYNKWVCASFVIVYMYVCVQSARLTQNNQSIEMGLVNWNKLANADAHDGVVYHQQQ